MNLHLPGTCFVELISNSGFTESGIYLFDHDDAKDMHHRPIGMIVRVTDTHKCKEIQPGKVYIIQEPYAFAEASREDGTDHRIIMSEENFICELEGYDEQSRVIADDLESECYPVCGKC